MRPIVEEHRVHRKSHQMRLEYFAHILNCDRRGLKTSLIEKVLVICEIILLSIEMEQRDWGTESHINNWFGL